MNPLSYPLRDDEVLVFLHIPKTAGLSFIQSIQCHFERNEVTVMPQKVIEQQGNPREYLKPYRFIAGHNNYSIQKYLTKKSVFVTMLRHPIERTISAYYHAQRDVEHEFHQLALSHDLEGYLENRQVRNAVTNLMSRYLYPDVVWEDIPDHIVQLKQRLDGIRFVGITSMFEESLLTVHHHFGWAYNQKVPKLNVNTERKPVEEISYRVRQDIQSMTTIDMELYRHGVMRLTAEYRSLASQVVSQYLSLPSEDKKTLYSEIKRLEEKLNTLEAENTSLQKLVNNPQLLSGLYRLLLPLSIRIKLRHLWQK